MRHALLHPRLTAVRVSLRLPPPNRRGQHMATQLTPLGRSLVMTCGLVIVGSTIYRSGLLEKLIPHAKERAAIVPAKVDLPDAAASFNGTVTPIADPGTSVGCTDKPEVR